MEVEVTEWLKLAVEDDSTVLPLEEYKNLLMESRFFPVQSDLDEVFKEIVQFIKEYENDNEEDLISSSA